MKSRQTHCNNLSLARVLMEIRRTFGVTPARAFGFIVPLKQGGAILYDLNEI